MHVWLPWEGFNINNAVRGTAFLCSCMLMGENPSETRAERKFILKQELGENSFWNKSWEKIQSETRAGRKFILKQELRENSFWNKNWEKNHSEARTGRNSFWNKKWENIYSEAKTSGNASFSFILWQKQLSLDMIVLWHNIYIINTSPWIERQYNIHTETVKLL